MPRHFHRHYHRSLLSFSKCCSGEPEGDSVNVTWTKEQMNRMISGGRRPIRSLSFSRSIPASNDRFMTDSCESESWDSHEEVFKSATYFCLHKFAIKRTDFWAAISRILQKIVFYNWDARLDVQQSHYRTGGNAECSFSFVLFLLVFIGCCHFKS